jgi:signal transduction histidine kinase
MLVNAPSWFRWLGFSLITLLAICTAGCNSTDTIDSAPLVQSKSWKMDPSGQAKLQDISSPDGWQVLEGDKSWGRGSEPIWVRFTLRAALPDEKEPWILRVNPSYLDHLTLHDPSVQLVSQTGDSVTGRNDALGGIHFTFRIAALPYQRDVYLRMQTTSSRVLMTKFAPFPEAQKQNRKSEWFLGFLIATSIIFAALGTLQWAIARERVMGTYAVKQWMASLWAFSTLGFSHALLGDYIPLETLSIADNFVRIWTIAATTLFFATLFQDYRISPVGLRATMAVVTLIVALPFLQFIEGAYTKLVNGNILVMASLFLLWTLLLVAKPLPQKEPLPYKLLLVYFTTYTLINFIPSAIRLNWLPMNSFLLTGNLIHVLLDGLVIFLLLQLRARNMNMQSQRLTKENAQISASLEKTQQVLTFEQRQRAEQSQFLHMLMQELKTPLSIVSLALGTQNNREENLAHASRAVQDMKAIIERCVQSDQSGELQMNQQRQTVDVVGFLRQQEQAIPKLKGRFDLAADPSLPQPNTDPQLLQIIVTNLLTNAAHYSDPLTPVGVTLKLSTQHALQGLELRVSNTPGLAGWPDAEQLFSKYYRASGAQRESGTGLGLFLSRELAQSLGGSLTYAPSPQHVEFVLWIPLHSA